MKGLRLIIISLILSGMLLSCSWYKSESENQSLKLPQEFRLQENTLGLIYYFDGDCSLCFHRINNFKEALISKSELRGLYFKGIGITSNVDLFNFNMNKFDLSDYIILDSEDKFFRDNVDIAILNNTYLINESGEIIEQFDSHIDFEELIESISKEIKALDY